MDEALPQRAGVAEVKHIERPSNLGDAERLPLAFRFAAPPPWPAKQRALARTTLPSNFFSMPASAAPDHEQIAHARQVAIYRAMAPQERLLQALRMNRTMRALLAAGFRSRYPKWTDRQVSRAVADRILYARTG
jgi:hypothetical protein